MRKIFVLLFAIISLHTSGQVAINTDNSVPDSTAMLDVKSNSRGLLIPRLTLAERTSITAPANGLLIYQTVIEPGFYFNSGSAASPVWKSLATGSGSWSTIGNAGIGAGNFIGTTDNNPLRFRVNNIPAGLIDPVLQNISIGGGSLYANTTGTNNIAIGWGTLNNNTVGTNMVAIGDSALYNQSTSAAYFNTAVGSKALFANTIGYENTAVGNAALISNTIGTDNTAIGDGALRVNVNGHANTAVGLHTLYRNVDGIYNTAVGTIALNTNVSGNFNSALGFWADVTTDTFSNATAIGYNTKVDASNKVRIGNVNVISIGGQQDWTTFSDGRFKKKIAEDVPGMAFIRKLRPVTYNVDLAGLNNLYNKSNDNETALNLSPSENPGLSPRQSGFIAQEVEQAALESGFDFSGVDKPTNDNALYGLRYGDFVVPIIKGMQEQHQLIEKQNHIIEILEERIQRMEALIKDMTTK